MLNQNRIVRLSVALCVTGALCSPAWAQSPGISSDTSGPNGSPANPDGAVTRGNGTDCTFVDFEGVGNDQPVGTVSGVPEVTFGASWLGLIDEDAGGSGNFANEPSPDTVTYFLSSVDPIDFDTGVQYVELYYSASSVSLPVTLTAWDGVGGSGNEVDSVQGNTVGSSLDGADCTGDPTGAFCGWSLLTLSAPSNTIRSVTLAGAEANQFGFDNMRYCTSIPPDAPSIPAAGMALLATLLVAGGALAARRFV